MRYAFTLTKVVGMARLESGSLVYAELIPIERSRLDAF